MCISRQVAKIVTQKCWPFKQTGAILSAPVGHRK